MLPDAVRQRLRVVRLAPRVLDDNALRCPAPLQKECAEPSRLNLPAPRERLLCARPSHQGRSSARPVDQ